MTKLIKMPRGLIWSKAIIFTTAFLMAMSKKKIHWSRPRKGHVRNQG